MKTILNVGLKRNDGGTNLIVATVVALDQAGYGPYIDGGVEQSDTEPTLVVEVDQIGRWADTIAMCQKLGQDCIAVLPAVGTGYLIGPKAVEWGPFDPTKFIMPDGRKLSETKGDVK